MTTLDALNEYRFSGYRLDLRQRKLFAPDDSPLNLSSRAFDTLLVLVEHAGQTLSKTQLMDAVWPSVVVEENNLNQAISSLRKALGDTKSENRFILTVPGKGYCFIATVDVAPNIADPASASPVAQGEVVAAAVEPARKPARSRQLALVASAVLAVVMVGLYFFNTVKDETNNGAINGAMNGTTAVNPSAATTAPANSGSNSIIRNSIAVLPFANLNPSDENALFALGLHDEIINQLTKIRSLNVIGRTSVIALVDQQLPIAEISRVLRVESVMSGTILFAGEHARVNLQLLDPVTGVTLWAGTYEANTSNISEMISIQSDIALHVASALEAEIQQSEQERIAALPTESFKAYRYNMAAKSAHYHQDYQQEWNLSGQAIELDPTYYDALYTFSSVNAVLVATPLPGKSSREHGGLALASAEKMIELAPENTEGHALKALALGTTKDWEGVSRELDILTQMETPASELKYIALLLLCLGDFDKAIGIYEANLLTEPLNLYGRGFLMAAQELSGNRAQARSEYEAGEELNQVWWGDTVNVFLAMGRGEPLEDVEELVGIPDELKHLLAQLHDKELVSAGLQAFLQRDNKVSNEALYYAALAAYIGDHERAVELMRISLSDVWTALFWFWLPVFDETRELASFRQVLTESGIVEYWKENGWPDVCQPAGDSFTCDWKAYPLQ